VLETRSADTTHFRAGTPKGMKGALRLASGFEFDSGWVFIRGTGLISPIGKSGAYDLGVLPAAAAKMALGLRYQARPKSTHFVLVKPDSAQIGKWNIVPGVLLNAPSSCLDSLPGSQTEAEGEKGRAIPPDSALANAARQACTGRVGTLVEVQLADSANRALRLLGRFVISDTSRIFGAAGFKPVPVALPADCISKTGNLSRYETCRMASGGLDEILVNDVSAADSCHAGWD
jgi:hypothetical protein